MATFKVELKKVVDDTYDIEIGNKLAPKLVEDIENGLVGKIKKFAVITDSNVAKLYAEEIRDSLRRQGYEAEMFIFPAGEKSKTRKTKEVVEDAMLTMGFRRDCCIIAVGGGVVTDISGFIAGTYGRGVPFINYATSLLAAADASVGGKTAVDTPLATNLIGLINQPVKVYIDLESWKTLPEREIYSGLAETIKHACLADREFFEYLESHMEDLIALDQTVCEHVAAKNCSIKYNVVMKDEREAGLREVLNLGHTIGRAIETVSEYRLLHGEALAIGMKGQVMLANDMGYLSEEDMNRVVALMNRAHLSTDIPEYIDREVLVKKLYTDKKVRDGKIRFVIQKGIGDIATFGEEIYATPVSEDKAREIIMKM